MKLKNRSLSKHLRFLLLGITAISIGSSIAIACGWSFISDDSVRFNSYRTGRGFYRLPPLPIDYDARTGKEISTNDSYQYFDDGSDLETEAPQEAALRSWKAMTDAVGSGDVAVARTSIESYLAITESSSFDDSTDRQAMRNTAFDMLDTLGALKEGASAEMVSGYLKTRLIYHDGTPLERVPEVDMSASQLEDNWSYLRAANDFKFGKKREALRQFLDHSINFPKSEKNQSARYMIGRILAEGSRGADAKFDCELTSEIDSRSGEIGAFDNVEKCVETNLESALATFTTLLKDDPNSRFRSDLRGWIAHAHAKLGAEAESLAMYYKMLGDRSDRNARLEAKKSLQILGHEHDKPVLDKTENLIAGDVDAAMAYAYHRIYNHAVDLTYDEPNRWDDPYSESGREDRETVRKNLASGKEALERTVTFAETMLRSHPQAPVTAGFLVRISEAELELQKWDAAKQTARKAISGGASGELKAEALWVIGSAQHARKEFKASRSTFVSLVKEYPGSRIVKGARRMIAISAEDEGDLSGALEQYVILDYKEDIAYLLDVLMPVDEIKAFTDSHPHLPGHDQRLYSLGIRYMRERQWDNARRALNAVHTKFVDRSHNEYFTSSESVKSPYWDDELDVVASQWVTADLQTIETLEHHEKLLASALDDETKAEAMYQLASFQFDADDLLFYNPAIWGGARIYHMYDLEVGDGMRQAGESQTLLNYAKKHETLARAIPIYQEIVVRFPQTKAAKDALYSMVVAHEKLSDLNPYWREMYGRGSYAGTRRYDNSNIRAMFPNFRWPKSRLGWEASTRTVNGGYAYEALPKPKPPKPTPSIQRRVKGKLINWYVKYSPTPIDAVSSTVSSAVGSIIFYLKLQMFLYLAAFGTVLVWSNRLAILELPRTQVYQGVKAWTIRVFRAVRYQVVHALPRLSIFYFVRRIYEHLRRIRHEPEDSS